MNFKNLLLPLAFIGALNAQTATKPAVTPVKKVAGTKPKSVEVVNLANKAKLVETVAKKGAEIVIPYKKYLLPNGLQIVVHEDHSDPMVYVDVTYHVGSHREQEGRSGFAHFFEHMMFQGSKHVADEEHFKIITEAGGELNGSTNSDRTNYFETVPKNQLETMLWLEADRMGFLLDSVTQKKFEVQRATVKNERGQRYDNAPYGLVNEKVGEALYPEGHPYRWSTIGYLEDLDRVDVSDLKRFYMRWYGPNNATLTITGDVNTDAVIKLVEKYFGSIPRGPEVKPLKVADFKLDANRYISYEDNVKLPLIKMVWPTTAQNTADEPALDILASILGDSKLSPFYVNFIKSQKAVSASVSHPTRELAGALEITVRANKDGSLADIEKQIREVLNNWEEQGIKQSDIDNFNAYMKNSTIRGLSTVRGKGSQLAAYNTYQGNPNQIAKNLSRYAKVTIADIKRVYAKYIKGQPCVILSCVPKGKGDLKAAADTWTMPKRNIQSESSEYKNLTYTEPKDNFDRSKKPVSGENPSITVPKYYTNNFENGLKIIGVNSTELPLVDLQISIPAGHRYEAISKNGLAYLTANLLNESTLKRSAEEVGEALEKLGSTIDVSAGPNDVTIYVSTLKSNLDATLKIAEEILLQPKFDSTEFARAVKQTQDLILQQNTQATTMANKAYAKLLYGPEHIMAYPVTGSVESIKSITLADVKEFYFKQYSPQNAKLVVVGDIKPEELYAKANFLKTWKANAAKPKYVNVATPAIESTKIYFIDKKAAPQSEIRIGKLTIPYDATGEYYKANLMNFAFGGAFNSRINLNLRELHGYTYGARGAFNANEFNGVYTISAGVKANTTDSSIVECIKEIQNFVNGGITEAELSFTKSSIGQAEATTYEAPQQKLGFIKRILDYNLSADYIATQNSILSSFSKAEADALAKKHIDLNKMVILVVGDKESNLEKLKKLGYTIVELDANGDLIK